MAPGTYVGTGNVNLNLASKRIVLTTADGPSNTIIDGQDIFGSKGLEVSSGEDTTAVVSGYTFTRFNSNYGGAIRCDGSSPRIENNRFIDNHATDGGAIYATSGSIKIRNNEFFANDAYRGGAIFIFGFTSNGPEIIGNWIDSCWSQSEGGGVYLQNIATGVSIRRNVFSRNVCGGLGGAVMLATAHNVLIHNNTFDLNSAEQGGAIEVLSSSSVGIRNNIIARSSQGFGIYIYSGGVGNYNCLFQNLPDHYGGEQSPSTSDIIGDPFFYMAPPTYYGIRANSPCIDAGDPDPTFDDADGSRSDIGALPYDGKLEFELVSPVGDTVVPTYFPYFVWHALPDTTAFGKFYYQVIWSSTQAFLLADSSALSSDSFWLSTLPFAASTKWYWKVVAESDFGVLVNSWQAGHFEIDGHPSTPQVLSPPDSAEVMLLDWLICSEAIDPDTDDSIWYNFQFDSSSLFNSIAVDVSIRSDSMGLLNLNERVDITGAPVATVFLGASLNDDTYYYWRVRAIDSHGGMSEFSVPTLSIFLNLQNTDPFAVDSVLSP